MSSNTFNPGQGLTAALAVTATSTATPIQVKGINNNATQRMFYNAGPNDCWIVGTKKASDAVAVVPTAGSPALGIPIPVSKTPVFLSFPPDTFFAAICAAASTAALYITPGEGVGP